MTEQTPDRGSSKHGPALDDEMAHEVEGQVRSGQPSRAEEWHDPEPPVDRDEDSSGAGTEAGSQTGTDPVAESLESEPERTPGYDVEAEQADQRAQGERDARAEQEAEEAMRPRSDQLPE